ncbi:hypothetical protein DFR52_102496 [Hoeflea marina]|uniref:Uncharacterized protein n=1 Tax=Hoeflea marina TaxID=274592 RepID=A0A317PLM1_9HYPH|nr:hypothetical protein DFR52_102496 [Hoeflea marina]
MGPAPSQNCWTIAQSRSSNSNLLPEYLLALIHPFIRRAILAPSSAKTDVPGQRTPGRRKTVAFVGCASVAQAAGRSQCAAHRRGNPPGRQGRPHGSPGAVARAERARLVRAGGRHRETRAYVGRRARQERNVQAVLRPEFISSRAAAAAERRWSTARVVSCVDLECLVSGRHRVRHRRGVGDHANSIPGTTIAGWSRAPRIPS